MSASSGRPLGATGNRSGAAAPARRTVRNHWFVVRSSWLKTTLPANSLTAVAAPGDAIVSAWAAGAATPSTARAEARTRRRRDMACERMLGGGRGGERSGGATGGPYRQGLGAAAGRRRRAGRERRARRRSPRSARGWWRRRGRRRPSDG